MRHIEDIMGTTMMRPEPEQMVYLDLSQPDTVVVFGEEEGISGMEGIAHGFGDILAQVFAYF